MIENRRRTSSTPLTEPRVTRSSLCTLTTSTTSSLAILFCIFFENEPVFPPFSNPIFDRFDWRWYHTNIFSLQVRWHNAGDTTRTILVYKFGGTTNISGLKVLFKFQQWQRAVVGHRVISIWSFQKQYVEACSTKKRANQKKLSLRAHLDRCE